VSNNRDDAEELISNGDMYRDSSDLEFGYDDFVGGLQIVGMRFQSVNIPQGAIINSAYIEFVTDETDSGVTNLVIFGESEDTARGFANNSGNISSRTKTAASVNWSPAAWNSVDELQQTPDISIIIQEIVNRNGWAANNDLVLTVQPGSNCTTITCQRTAESHDGESGSAPMLVIDYTVKPTKLSVSANNVTQEYEVGSYGGSIQDRSGAVEIRDAGRSLYLDGNRWQKIDFPYTVTPNTVIEFDFQSTVEGEIQGLGFDNDLSISEDRTFKIYGTQDWGNQSVERYGGSGTTRFSIPVGELYTGNFQYLFFIHDDDSNPTGNSLFSNIIVYEGKVPIAEYRFEEQAWSGAVGEVTDETGSFNARAINGAAPQTSAPAIDGNPGTCGYGSFDGVNDYVALPDTFGNLTDSFTVTAWINPSNVNAGSRIFIDDEQRFGQTSGFGFSLGDPGNGRLRFYSRNVNPVIVDTTASIAPNTWTFVAAVHNSTNKTRQIFINGVAQTLTGGGTTNTYTGIWGQDDGPATIGGETDLGETGNRFTGDIDEVKIYADALSESDITAIYQQTHPCSQAVVHHYEIIHDGGGLTCEAETVLLKACANASCNALSSGVITVDVKATGSASRLITDSVTFDGSKQEEASIAYTFAESTVLSIENASIPAANPTVCFNGSTNSCNLVFSDAGFRFLSGSSNSPTIPNQTSGVLFSETLKVQAVENTNGVCTSLFSGNKSIDLAQENVDPGGTAGLSFSTAGNTIAKHSGSTPVLLNFGADSIATIPLPVYNDAGQIRLHANYNDSGITLSGNSNTFWVSPAELVVNATFGGNVLDGASATAARTHKAGSDFELSVTALNSQGVITPNYSPGQIQLRLQRTGPTLSDSVDGALTYAAASTLTSNPSPLFQDVTLSNFALGVSTYNSAHYSEVGLINLDVQDSNYGNANIVIPAAAINVGRFIPDHFKQTVADNGFFAATCNATTAFTAYSGQKDEATNSIGAISYLTNPVIAITAYNKRGNITRNYYQDSQGSANDFMKLGVANVSINTPTLDQVAVGVDANRLPLTANMTQGTLSQNDLTALPGVVALPKGVLHYQLSDADNFFYNRSANALVAPFTSDIDFSVAAITDADNVNVTTTVDASPTGVEIRFGRLVLGNSFGPETSNFPQPMQLEHFDGTGFIVSSDNNCSNYDSSKMSLTNISLNPALTPKLGGAGSFQLGKIQAIELQAPGAGNQGQIGVSYDAYDWLKYDWDNDGVYDDIPSAIATFGIYRGNDRIIHWREVFE
jgi:MSHA biogenesis protein MshQ